MTNPRLTHLLDQLGEDLRKVAQALAVYREELERQRFKPSEVRELVMRMEDRLMGPSLDAGADLVKDLTEPEQKP
jgi:uncharacterized protein YpuA (DUF1002 family)